MRHDNPLGGSGFRWGSFEKGHEFVEAIDALVKDSVPNAHVAKLFAFVILQNELQSIVGDSGIFVAYNNTLQILRPAL